MTLTHFPHPMYLDTARKTYQPSSQPGTLTSVETATYPPYAIHISNSPSDAAWDDFVGQVQGGYYAQTSAWSQVDTWRGRDSAHFVISQGKRIVAGAQLTIQHLPMVGNFGYMSRGPLIASDDPALLPVVRQAIHQLARACGVQHLVIQPPRQHERLEEHLVAWGFQPSPVGAKVTATLSIDLTPDLDQLMARMRRSTRQSVRHGLKRGLTMRLGTDADLDAFYQLHAATSERQNFLPFPEDYMKQQWHILREHDMIQMFLIEYEGEILSGAQAITCGDLMFGTIFGWSGDQRNLHPNAALFWSAMRWGKENGYRTYDLGWVDPKFAQAVEEHDKLPEEFRQSPPFFKLGFGSQVMRYPSSYDYSYNPLLSHFYREMLPRFANSASARNALAHALNWVKRRS
jgi:lipid II:glycine glycyltransferase (peptidoglycan interpeptide bridge formation enzyme)